MNYLNHTAQTRTRKTRKGPGRPAAGDALTPQEVAEAALEIIVEDGEAALTMRRLGKALGVKAMALYNHFPNKESILDAVADMALVRVPLPPAKGNWRTRIKTLAHGIRSMAFQYPNLFRVAMNRPMPPSGGLPQIESALSALADAGLTPAAQATAYHTLRLYVRAYCLWEIEEMPLHHAEDTDVLARNLAPFPCTAAAADLIFTPDPDRQFEAGLDLILRGLRSKPGR